LEKTDLFVKVPSKRLYQRVAGQIRELVIAGTLQAGDRLPSEAELCDQFGVSRTVIREATKSLAERGLLSSQPGRGTFVTALSVQDLSDSFGLFVKGSDVSVRNVTEVRELLEVRIAELAAQRVTPNDLIKMEQAIEDMDRNMEDLDEFLRGDLDFHNALAEATHNDILVGLVRSLVEEFQAYRRMPSIVLVGNENSQRAHKAIFECVRNCDEQGAADAMREHLREVIQRYETTRLAGAMSGEFEAGGGPYGVDSEQSH